MLKSEGNCSNGDRYENRVTYVGRKHWAMTTTGDDIETTIWDEARNNGHNKEKDLRECAVLDITNRSRRWEQERPNGRECESALAGGRNT